MTRRIARNALPLLVPLLVATVACGPVSSPEPEGERTELPRSLTSTERNLVAASNEFGLGLLRRLGAAAPDSNVFVSPLSASMSLGMALNGAEGETFDAMRSTLALGDAGRDSIRAAYGDLVGLLRELDPRVDLRIANAVWYREGLPVLTTYRESTRDHFDAEVSAADFTDPSAAGTINGWVDDATAGEIPEIVAPAELRDVVALLVNAVYFRGDWTTQFDPERTREAPFTLDDGSTEPVPLMSRDATVPFARGDGWTAVDVPYGGGAFSMTVVLPDEGAGIDEFVQGLDTGTWSEIASALGDAGDGREVQLFLPRFELSYDAKLNDALSAMGMGVAFDGDAADFGRMVDLEALRPQNAYLSFVKQKSRVTVDERGTEAAAATSVGVGVTSAPATPTFRADRPFVFVLRERLSGTVLFAGKLERPPTN